MPNWYWYILIALRGKSAEFKFEMFALDRTFGKEVKEQNTSNPEPMIVFLCRGES